MKTSPEFKVEEAEFTGGHPENIKFEETTISEFGEHGSNFDEVEKFATGKIKKSKPTKKRLQTEFESGKAEADAEAAADMADDFASGGRVPLDGGGPININALIQLYMAEGMTEEEATAAANKPLPFHILTDKAEGGRVPLKKGGIWKWKQDSYTLDPEWDDMDADEWLHIIKLLRAGEFGAAEGGRVPFVKGKLAKYATPEGLAALIEKLFPGTTKLGKTSKPMAEKTQLKKAIADFQERNKIDDLGGSKVDPFSPDFDMRAEADLIARTPFKLKELKAIFGGQIDDNIIREIAAMDPAKQLKAIEDVKLYLRNMKNLRQETTLREFDITGLEPHAAGGVAGMLGE
jgi:hypothetical protein